MSFEINIIIIMLVFSGFFSGIETALLGLGPLDIVKDKKNKLLWLLNHKKKILSTLLIGNNFTIVAAVLALDRFLLDINDYLLKAAALSVQIFIFFLLGEAFPKAIYRKLGIRSLLFLYALIKLFYYLFYPLNFIILWLVGYMQKIIPDRSKLKKEDIFYFVDMHVPEKEPVAQSFLKLKKTTAREIMQPLPEIKALEKNMKIKEAAALTDKFSYTRYPVYEERGDNIIGYVNVYDYLSHKESLKIQNILYPPVFIPETLPVNKVLSKMQKEQLSMVFPVNEYGSVVGLITFENLAEEIVGDIISGEQTHETLDVIQSAKGRYLLDANMDIDDFNEFFSHQIVKEGFETLTGFIIKKLGRIPENNEKLNFDFGVFIITKADKKTIKRIMYEPK